MRKCKKAVVQNRLAKACSMTHADPEPKWSLFKLSTRRCNILILHLKPKLLSGAIRVFKQLIIKSVVRVLKASQGLDYPFSEKVSGSSHGLQNPGLGPNPKP